MFFDLEVEAFVLQELKLESMSNEALNKIDTAVFNIRIFLQSKQFVVKNRNMHYGIK
jgi:hypothetical protein